LSARQIYLEVGASNVKSLQANYKSPAQTTTAQAFLYRIIWHQTCSQKVNFKDDKDDKMHSLRAL